MPSARIPPEVQGTAADVRKRLDARLLVVKSLWFPTPRELRAWDQSGVPLYLRWLGPHQFEIGPWLASMWASAFSPVWRGEIIAEGERARLSWRRTWTALTWGVLIAWWIVVIGWAGALIVVVGGGQESPWWVLWWGLLALSTTAGPAVGWRFGGRALDAQHDWLEVAAADPLVDGEDW